MEQYIKNMGILNESEFKLIRDTNVLLIGVGGLGGFIASSLVRLGVRNITIIDFDKFETSNLNRQIFSNASTLGKMKVDVVKDALLEINPKVIVKAIAGKFDEAIDPKIFDTIDIVFDAVDNISTKILIEKFCFKFNKPLIHGAIAGWYGQVGIILPGSNILKELYQHHTKGIEETLKSPTFIPGIIGNIMISEFLKFTIKKEALINKILYVDVLEHEYKIIFQK